MTPLSPVAAADQLALTRLIIGRAARRHGLRVSLSPAPFAGSVRIRCPPALLADHVGGPAVFRRNRRARHDADGGERGSRSASRAAGSAGRAVRIDPLRVTDAARQLGRRLRLLGHREPGGRSAIRQGRPGHSARRQRRSKNRRSRRRTPTSRRRRSWGWRWMASGAKAVLPAETTIRPGNSPMPTASAPGSYVLPETQAEAIAALDNSTLLRGILGDPVVDMVVAVRHHGAGALRRPRPRATGGQVPDGLEPVTEPVMDVLGSGPTHRRRGVDRPACPRMLVDGGGPATVRERPQRGRHRTACTFDSGFDSQLGFAVRAHCGPHPGTAETR